MTQATEEGKPPRQNPLSNNVDFRIPIWGLLCAASAVGWALITNHFSTQQLMKDIAVLQSSVTTGQLEASKQLTTITQKAADNDVNMAELRIRVTNLESMASKAWAQQLTPSAASSASARIGGPR